MKSHGRAARLKINRLFLFFPVALFLAPTVFAVADTAAISQYSSRSWQLDEGLPHNQVQAITQTPDGYLWVGTRQGLAKFDGISFTGFDEKLSPGMKDAFVDALCTDRNGSLWIGTYNGLFCFKAGKCDRYGITNGLAGEEVNTIIEAHDGSLWIATTAGLSQFKNGRFLNYNQKNGLPSNLISTIYEDREGYLWIGMAEGVTRLKAGAMKFFAIAGGPVQGVGEDASGRLWVGSNNGLKWFDHGKFHADSPENLLPDALVVVIYPDSRGNLWVGTHSGLARFKDSVYFNEPNNEGMPYDKVNAVFEDREGNVWFGSREGLIRRTPKQLLTYTRLQGLSHNNIMSVLEDHDHNLWVATWGGGIDRLNGGKVTVNATSNGFPNNLILSMCEGRDGSLWVGADYDGGLVRFKDGKCTSYSWKDGLVNSPIRVIHEDRSGNIWAGTAIGLSCLRDGKFVNYTTTDNLAHNLVRAICEDHAGNLWIGTHGGLSRWRDGHFTNFSSEDGMSESSVIALYEDKETNLWIGTLGGGLNRYKDGRFTAYTTRQGLYSDDVFEIVEDDFGYLWMSCSRGIFRVLKKDLEDLDLKKGDVVACVSYNKSDGMESSQCNGAAKPAGWKMRDGHVCFPTTKGLVVAEPTPIPKPKEQPPPVYINEIIADNRKIDFGEWETTAAGAKSAVVAVPPGRGEFEFHYAALSLSAAEKNRFKYRLEGIDADWIDADTRRLAHYNNLYPGRYKFRVIGCNDHGIWNEAGAVVAFALLPHFWQTWWFSTMAGIVTLAAAVVGVRYWIAQKLRRQFLLLELQNSLEKERARIARDIHDDLGATLTQITLLSELTQRECAQPRQVTQHAEQIARAARELVQSMDETVWAVNPENDNLPRLAGYIFQYAEKFFSGSSLRCRFDSPEDLPAYTMTAEARHHLFLATKEALNNVARHSGATQVWLRLSLSDTELFISVEDNGRGLPAEAGRAFGNGLKNMKKRMEEIGGVFEWTSVPGTGTTIHFKLKIR